MIISIHQPSFMPWMPYFEKIHQSDIFCILQHCQFEKNGWTNRCKVNDKWWTNPVTKGKIPIKDKVYTNGTNLADVNISWIIAMCKMLGIDTNKIVYDFPTDKKGTERLAEICVKYNADKYLTNPDAVNKYLDKKVLDSYNIEIVPFISKNNKHVLELFNDIGIERTRGLLQ